MDILVRFARREMSSLSAAPSRLIMSPCTRRMRITWLLASVLVVSYRASSVFAYDPLPEPPVLGLFNVTQYLSSNSGVDAHQVINLLGLGAFDGFLDAAKLLAVGNADGLTSTFVDAALRSASLSENASDVGSILREFNSTQTAPLLHLLTDASTDEAFRRRAFASMFQLAMGATAGSLQSAIDPESELNDQIETAVSDALGFASLLSSDDFDAEHVVATMFDRASGRISRARDVLRRARADPDGSSLAEYANELFGTEAFADGNSRWIIKSSTAHPWPPQRDVVVEPSTANKNHPVYFIPLVSGAVVFFAGSIATAFAYYYAAVRKRSSVATLYASNPDAAHEQDATGVVKVVTFIDDVPV